MRVGDTYPFTKEQFLQLAPLGLCVTDDSHTYYYYHKDSHNHPLVSDDRCIRGYSIGTQESYQNSSYIAPILGLWRQFNGNRLFTIVSLPSTTLYRRSHA